MRHDLLQWISFIYIIIGWNCHSSSIVAADVNLITRSTISQDDLIKSSVDGNGQGTDGRLVQLNGNHQAKKGRHESSAKRKLIVKRRDGNEMKDGNHKSMRSKLKSWQELTYQRKLARLSNSWLVRESSSNDRLFERRKNGKIKNGKKPNIIFILTDDQDIELGSMDFMPRTMRILAEEGAHFPNAYVTTPMCCPSRSSILTGLYTHNHNVYTNNDNCSSPQWQRSHETRTFATHLQNVGYRTAFFGKYLNEYNGSYIPPGWREWSALVKNSRFYNYTLNINGRKVKHGDNYQLDYYPDLIINDSLTFFRNSKENFQNKPVMMMLSFPSPHGPEDSAPQFQHLFHNVTSHRTRSWNYAPNPDKQWLLRHSPKMEPIHMEFTDLLHTKRLQTLQSVDIAVERLYHELKELGELDRTYIFYTSDHGYHLGQFGLLKGKSMPFEFDIRVPFYVRGPKIPPGITYKDIVLNIDIAPTFMDIAGVQVPEYVDGKSVLPLFDLNEGTGRKKRKKNWRDSFLVERGKLAGETDEEEKPIGKKKWLKLACRKDEYKSPCGPNQRWECLHDGAKPRIKKCRNHMAPNTLELGKECQCSDRDNSLNGESKLTRPKNPPAWDLMLDSTEKKSGMRTGKNNFKSQPYSAPREKRSLFDDTDFNVDGVYVLNRLLDSSLAVNTSKKTDVGEVIQYHDKSGCFIFSNNSISCPEEVYNDKHAWKRKKETVDDSIRQLQGTLYQLKGIRRHLKRRRPFSIDSSKPCDCSQENLHWRHKFRRMRKTQEHKKERRLRRRWKFENTTCNIQKMNCFTHDNDHWKTPPLWTKGPFCFCQNANNNTFWCLRTINETHNFLYCEFITGFITYYDLNEDPYQLKNAVYALDWSELKKLRRHLSELKSCSGFKQCNQRHRSSQSLSAA